MWLRDVFWQQEDDGMAKSLNLNGFYINVDTYACHNFCRGSCEKSGIIQTGRFLFFKRMLKVCLLSPSIVAAVP